MTSQNRDAAELLKSGYRFAYALTHDAARAEDLIQEAWLAVLATGGPWSSPYFFRVIKNRFIDEGRRQKRMVFEGLSEDLAQDGAEKAEEWENGALELSHGCLEGALAKLRPEERAVLFLNAVEAMTASRIAELLDWPRGTVLSLMHRARRRLRVLLTPSAEKSHERQGVARTSC